MMKPEAWKQLYELFDPIPRITLADLEETIRKALRDDPEMAEQAIGRMYGGAFKKKEELYDAGLVTFP